MKKSLILFALLTLSIGLWAETQNVSYLYPVYNEGDVTVTLYAPESVEYIKK